VGVGDGTETSAFLRAAGGDRVLDAHLADVGRHRERRRRRRLVATLLGCAVSGVLVWQGASVDWAGIIQSPVFVPFLFFGLMGVGAVWYYSWSGRSPHIVYRPDQLDVRLDDVVGLDPVKEEVVRSINLFLAHATFAREMGGTPRRGLLFEGPPGTGKTHTAKAMAAEAGVPFLFATATSFQSSFYGATARKIRAFFTELRKTARREGGAIGFIDEFDAIAGTRRGLEASALPDGLRAGVTRAAVGTSDLAGPVVNELLVQMQSFDTPMGWETLQGKLIDSVNKLLPATRQLRRPAPVRANILLVASTNRADGLDPALLRPGRFDRRLAFEIPDKPGRRALVDHFLARKAHEPELDDPERRDALAAITVGYSPVMIEHLLDEALVNAVRRAAPAMSWRDLETARLATEVGVGQPVTYTEHEQRLIATHEAGHAAVAWLVAPQRRLEVLTIVKRKSSLGLLAHGYREDVYTRSRTELMHLVQIAFGGQVAEELFFGDISTGPASDLAYATGVAVQMVGQAGMGGSLVSFGAVQPGPFDTNLVGRVLADTDARARVEGLLEECRNEVRGLLSGNRHLIAALRDALMDRHELVGHEITDVLEAADAAAGSAHGAADSVAIDLRDATRDATRDARVVRTPDTRVVR
jgi:ATP-dependent Zn protease